MHSSVNFTVVLDLPNGVRGGVKLPLRDMEERGIKEITLWLMLTLYRTCFTDPSYAFARGAAIGTR